MDLGAVEAARNQEERQKFEEWARKEYYDPLSTYPLPRPPNGYEGYQDDEVDAAWIGWQARAISDSTQLVLLREQNAELVAALEQIEASSSIREIERIVAAILSKVKGQ